MQPGRVSGGLHSAIGFLPVVRVFQDSSSTVYPQAVDNLFLLTGLEDGKIRGLDCPYGLFVGYVFPVEKLWKFVTCRGRRIRLHRTRPTPA
jgi:hypothetical protein